MGCSNPHPHGQAWSLSEVPHIPSLELASLAKYSVNPDVAPSNAPRGPKGRPCMLCEYAHFEVGVAEAEGRVVVKNEDWVALVPWWATWPFEVLCMFYSLCFSHLALLTNLQCSPTNVTSRLLPTSLPLRRLASRLYCLP